MHFISGKLIAVDTETTGLDAWHGDEPFAFGFCNEKGVVKYFEWEVDPYTRVVVPRADELEAIGELMADPKVEKVFHNAKFDVRMMEEAFGIKTRGVVHDTMFAAHCCNSLEPNYKLKDLSKRKIDYGNEDEVELERAVLRARREGKKRGWALGVDWHRNIFNEIEEKAAPKADYWMPRALDPENDLCVKYLRGDVERTMLLFHYYRLAMEELGVEDAYRAEQELWWVTYEMEARGVRIRKDKLDAEIEKFYPLTHEFRDYLRSEATRLGFPDLNCDASQDVATFAYEHLKLPVTKWTPTGRPAADSDALNDHFEHPWVSGLFKYRSCKNGLVNFFFKYLHFGIPEEEDLILHPDFQQVGPATGRYSCRNPNLQNVANALTTRSPIPLQARGPFAPRDGYTWYCIDYSQLEVRIFASISKERSLLEALRIGEDIHNMAANKAWGGEGRPQAILAAEQALEFDGASDGVVNLKVKELWDGWGLTMKNLRSLSPGERTRLAREWLEGFEWDVVAAEASVNKKNSRAKAKMIFFAKIFGGGPGAVKDLLKCSEAEARAFMADWDRAFPDIVRSIRNLSDLGRAQGFIRTVYDRRISVNPDKPYRACNYVVQGSAADLLKRSMVACSRYLKETGLDARIVMTIHDELVFEIRKEHTFRWLLRDICRIMEDHGGVFSLETPVEISKVQEGWDSKDKAVIGDWNRRRELEWVA